MNVKQSKKYMAKAKEIIPGGVNSPVRAFQAVGGETRAIARGEGSLIIDVDGNRYLDYIMSWGALLHGHAHPYIVSSAGEALKRGSSFGAPCRQELDLASILVERVPGLEMVRLVNSGTEAGMSVLRLARAHTGREAIIKFAGCYHGHTDSLLVSAGSGAATFGVPSSPGVAGAEHTIVLPYNDAGALEKTFKKKGDKIAAVIVELVAGNMGLVLPDPEFVKALSDLPRKHGSLLIVDEVMSGFRAGPQGAQGVTGINGDLIMLGKVIGGGFPLAAYGGKAKIMKKLAPEGPVYQAGTLSGNPVACAAGIASLNLINDETFDSFDRIGNMLTQGLSETAASQGIPLVVTRSGAMVGMFFNTAAVTNFEQAAEADHKLYAQVFQKMLEHGIMFPPSGYETFFLSSVHTKEDIERTIVAFGEVLDDI
jgi:glutamate-1-semialdehyde 2,1-aminomutase